MNNTIKIHNTVYFIHIPKTSGSSLTSKQIIKLGHRFNVKNIYRIPKKKKGHRCYHTNFYRIYEYPKTPNTKISIIRNPFDLLCSYYHHGHKLNPNGEYCHSGWASVNYTHQFKTFKEFITAYCNPNFKWHVPQLQKFLFSQLFDINHNCVADIIIKYEYFDEAKKILNTKLEHPMDRTGFKMRSRNKKKTYKEYYDKDMIELVNKKCYRELKYFNYNFDGSTKHEPLIINCNLKYDIYNDKIIN
tara:strand:- start:3093 stop:3827 length:735 start_codon:yes stop_codon:yes gene_type:complete